ncbi:hypothetical protein ACFL34_04560 [Candidatus Sumerlaeota bacterium]
MPPPALAGVIEDKSQTKRRIVMIAKFSRLPRGWSVAAIVLMMGLGAVALTNPKARPTSAEALPASGAPATSGAPKSSGSGSGGESFQTVRPIASVKKFDDVRWKDMSKLDLSGRPGLPATLTFNEKTDWPSQGKMPTQCDTGKLLREAMNPGLGVRELHRAGITGIGVNVAIIDQPLYQDHPEFAGKIAAYHDVGCDTESSMHGPAVASLLVGKNCGTAPGAKVYFVAAPSWKRDSAYQAKALDWLIAQNEKLAAGEKNPRGIGLCGALGAGLAVREESGDVGRRLRARGSGRDAGARLPARSRLLHRPGLL